MKAALLLLLIIFAPAQEARAQGPPPLGAALVITSAGAARHRGAPLAQGAVVRPGERLTTAAGGRLELRFSDGTLLRLGAGADVALPLSERRVDLRAGRLLVHSDPMVGGLSVATPVVMLQPLGTTYVVEALGDATEVLVLEGAVQVLRPAGRRTEQAVLLPGEGLRVLPQGPLPRPEVRPILLWMAQEVLLTSFSSPLPALDRIRDLATEQRRGVLAGRNERLRRELRWRRPPARPLILPELFR